MSECKYCQKPSGTHNKCYNCFERWWTGHKWDTEKKVWVETPKS